MSAPFPYVDPTKREEEPVAPSPLIIPTVSDPARDDPVRALADRRIVFVRGRIDDAAANDIVAQLLTFDGRRDDAITLLVNSTGGPLTAIVPVLDTIAGCHSPVAATAIGQANGTAALLLALATGERLVAPNASVCLRLEPEPSVTGTTDQVAALADQRRELEGRLADELARRSAFSRDEVCDHFTRGHPIPAADAVAASLADRTR
ncbi:MAG: ATP-dependent Clp protease proteolytic subunit [Actinobacteria bacterium]|nr:ATP-dependent Clp protease proteolytic subunit [Actinomycetota bacterium]